MNSLATARSPSGVNEGYLKRYFVRFSIPLGSRILTGFQDILPKHFSVHGQSRRTGVSKEADTKSKSNLNIGFSVKSISGHNLNKEFLLKRSEYRIHFASNENYQRLQIKLDKFQGGNNYLRVIAYYVHVESYDYNKMIGYQDLLKTLQEQSWKVQKNYLKDANVTRFGCSLLDHQTDNKLTFLSDHAIES